MKPKELLGLIEEVSGTRMYEVKRANAVKVVEKKEQKLMEINNVLSEEIQPNVERLQKEKTDYQNYVTLKESLHHFQRFDTAYRYYCAKQTVQHGVEAFADLQRQRATLLNELEETDRQREELEKQLEALEAARAEKDAPLKVLRKKKEEIEKELSRLHADARSCKRDLDMLKTSVKDQEKEEKRLAKALEARRSSRSTEAAQAEQLAEEVEKTRNQLQEKSEKLQAVSSGGDVQGIEAKAREQRARISELKLQLEALGNSDGEAAQLQASYVQLQEKHRAFAAEAQEAMQELRAWAKIDVRLPRGFDPARFFGQIFELVSLKDEFLSYSKALQVLVGGKLEYIVVRDKDASKSIFKENNFAHGRRRVTLLPLSDCHVGRVCDMQALEANRRLVGLAADDSTGVLRCLDMVEFDRQRHSKVAEYVFGGSLICRTSAMAQKITYQKNYRFAFPTATEEGDVFQAGGVMAGGSVRDVRQTMLVWKRFKDATANAEETARSIRVITNPQYSAAAAAAADDDGLLEMNLFLSAIEAQLAPLQARAQQAATLQKSLRLAENQLQNVESLLGSSDAEACRLRLTELKNSISAKEELIKTGDVRLQLQTMQQELEGARADLAARMKKTEELQQQLDQKNAAVKEKELEHEGIEADLMERATESKKENQQQMRVAESLKKIAKAKEAKSLALKKEVKQLLAAHEWLVAEEPKFNQTGSPYDFKQLRPETARQRIQQLKADVERLGKNVNSSAGMLLEKTEAELQTLLNRKAQVEADREKIKEVIASLDEKKKNSLKNTWRLVDGNFSAIFEQLLPNAQAKLVQVDPDDLVKGLEMKGLGFKV
ncbi:hypothetical protein Emed_007259 [Eimeria media]